MSRRNARPLSNFGAFVGCGEVLNEVTPCAPRVTVAIEKAPVEEEAERLVLPEQDVVSVPVGGRACVIVARYVCQGDSLERKTAR